MQESPPLDGLLKIIGRYALYGQLAAGGMAAVHLGRLLGPAGFSRTVAIKRLHPQFAKDPEFVAMFLDEARLAARIQHPNVVATVDVVARDEELFLVMDYIRGESLSRLLRASRKLNVPVRPKIIASIVAGMLHGLHAAHEAKDERGHPLAIVHRDVSPQNVIIGVDGVPRVLDFGVAKAAARVQVTRNGQMKGKLCYMSPEQLRGKGVDRRSDVFAAGIVLWEALTGRRLFDSEDGTQILDMILRRELEPPSKVASVPGVLDLICARALERNPELRYQTARDFAVDLEEAVSLASPREVGEWVESVAGTLLSQREDMVAEIEIQSSASEATAGQESARRGPTGVLDGGKVGQRDSTQVQVPRPSGRPSAPPPASLPPAHADQVAQDGPSVVFAREKTILPGRTLARTTAARRVADRFLDPGRVPTTPAVRGPRRGGLLLVGGVAAAVVVFLGVFLLARMQRQNESDPRSADETREAMRPEMPARPEQPEQRVAPVRAIDPSDLPLAESESEESSEGAAVTERSGPKRANAPSSGKSPRTEAARAAEPAEPKGEDKQPEGPTVDLSNPYAPRSEEPPHAPARSAPEAPPVAAPKAGACAQPFAVDPSGIRRIKPECL